MILGWLLIYLEKADDTDRSWMFVNLSVANPKASKVKFRDKTRELPDNR